MPIFLGGGGSSSESRELDQAFARALRSGSLVYWPFAMADERSPRECEAWLRATFEPLGVHDFETWPDLDGRDLRGLGDAAGLYIGGGNTFRLLRDLRTASVAEALRAVMGSLPIYGGSAGAAVLGATIETIDHLDGNHVGITDPTGLRLLGETSVWVHYEPSDRPWIEDFFERSTSRSLLVLPVDGGVVVDDSTVRSVGFSSTWHMTPTTTIELPPGASLTIADVGA